MNEKNIKNIQEYIKQELEKPNCEIGVFKKNTRVKARQGEFGDKPKDKPIIALKINENICFDAPWDEKMHIKKDGYLNITEPNSIYGIQNKEFQNTYASLSNKNADELNETLAEFYDLVVSFSSENVELPDDLNKIIDEIINNYEALNNIEYNEPFRPIVQDNDKTLDEIIKDTDKPNVLWFSRHDMTPEQREAIGGDRVNINQINKTINSAYELKDEIENADVIAIVAPINLQQQFLKLADGKPVIMAVNDRVLVPQPDGSEDKVEFKFNKWEQIKEIKIEKEDFNFDKCMNNKNNLKEYNMENER